MRRNKLTNRPTHDGDGAARSQAGRVGQRSRPPRLARNARGPLERLRQRLTRLEAQNRELRAAQVLGADPAHLRQVIDASPVPLSVDDMKGKIEYLNRKFVEKFGYSHKELPTSASWFRRAYPNAAYRRQVAEQWRACLQKGLGSGHEVGPLEVEVTCKDGSRRRVEFLGTFFGDRLLIAANDLTDRERLEKQILQISEEERERIGQDLHDGLCQLLSGIKFRTTLLEQKLKAKAPSEARAASAVEALLNRAIQEARNMARGLHPVALEAQGLMSALDTLAASVRSLYGIACICRFDQPVLVHDHLVATHLYRIAQEAINNAIRHGHARQIYLRLAGRADFLTLRVEDNGIGFRTHRISKTGMGLHLMNYRARAIGASLEIGPGPRGGTLVTCKLREPNSRHGRSSSSSFNRGRGFRHRLGKRGHDGTRLRAASPEPLATSKDSPTNLRL